MLTTWPRHARLLPGWFPISRAAKQCDARMQHGSSGRGSSSRQWRQLHGSHGGDQRLAAGADDTAVCAGRLVWGLWRQQCWQGAGTWCAGAVGLEQPTVGSYHTGYDGDTCCAAVHGWMLILLSCCPGIQICFLEVFILCLLTYGVCIGHPCHHLFLPVCMLIRLPATTWVLHAEDETVQGAVSHADTVM